VNFIVSSEKITLYYYIISLVIVVVGAVDLLISLFIVEIKPLFII